MTPGYLETVRRRLEGSGVVIRPGLSDVEIGGIESDFGFRFPPDLRALLQSFLPEGEEFPDWRRGGQRLLEWLDEPADGIAFDVEENGIWLPSWGERPDNDDDAVEEALRLVALAPPLIPLAGHRYLPARPGEEGNPVFSVVQTDVIVYAEDLGGWLEADYAVPRPPERRKSVRNIEFWSELTDAAASE